MRVITFDIETANTFQEAGSSNPADLDIAVVAIHDSKTNEYKCFLQEDFSKLWKILEEADILVGYNSNHFDIPLLNKYFPGELTHIKSLDILAEIYNSLGRRLKLDIIAEATLGESKSANGLQSIRWWKEGKVKQVCDYCKQDVKVTRKIYEYALENKKLKYKDLGKVREFPINTDDWNIIQDSSITKTLF